MVKTKDAKDIVEKEKQKLQAIPSGKFVSGRVWKEKSHKFSDLVIQNQTRTNWSKKMELKNSVKNAKQVEEKIKQEKKDKKLDLIRRQKLNEERRKINEAKAEIVQAVKNPKKLKRNARKMLKKV